MVDADLITEDHAARAWENSYGVSLSEGSIFVGDELVDYWVGEDAVWFYEQGHDGEDTIARFAVEVDFWRIG